MRKYLLSGVVSVCLLASQVQAVIINLESSEFTLLSEQRLITQKGVEVYGLVGATDAVRLGKGTLIDSDVYTDGRFKAASFSSVTGRLIASDDILISARAKMGMLDGGSNARIGKQATVFGDIALAGDLQRHPEANILGSSILTNTELNDLWSAASLPPPVATSFLPEDSLDDITVAKNSLGALEPGDYGSIKLKKNSTLTLTAGTYFFDKITLDGRSTLMTDTRDGAVTINVANKMRTHSKATVEKEGPDQATFTVFGRTKIGSHNNLFTNIVAQDRLKIGNHSQLTGFYYSKDDLRLGKEVVVNGLNSSSEPAGAAPTIPEPATFLLLGLGSLGLRVRKRRKLVG